MESGEKYVDTYRYADFTILVKSQRAGERVLHSISRYLQDRLKRVVNTTKNHVIKTHESKFLGFTFQGKKADDARCSSSICSCVWHYQQRPMA